VEIGIAIVFVVGSVVLLRMNKKHAISISIVYLLAVIYLAFLVREPTPTYRYSLKLFDAASRSLEFGGVFISGLLSGNVKTLGWSSLKGIVLNILLFIPFGYLIPVVWPQKEWFWWKILLLGLVTSFCIEITQLVTRLGFADVDDLMNNTVGAVIGYLLYKRCLTHVVNNK
jgi:glycopeptide antibiotics resistance protein